MPRFFSPVSLWGFRGTNPGLDAAPAPHPSPEEENAVSRPVAGPLASGL